MTITPHGIRPGSRSLRVLGRCLAACALGLGLLVGFDVVLRDGATLWSAPLFKAWPLIPVCGALSVSLYLATWGASHGSARLRATQLLRPLAHVLALLAGAPVLLTVLDDEIYRPIKFSYLIRAVESARSAEAELRAFRLADRWGYVWELNRLEERSYVPQRARDLPRERLVELEWLECGPSGVPYRAYRQVLDERNLQVLGRRGRANH